MAMVFKCKLCGGDISFTPGATYGTCEYCGSISTIPNLKDDNKLNRFNRADHFRRQGEFDKALAVYEILLEQDDTDAEAHWGAVLSRYGIEYVEDPATKKRIPTCHRVQPKAILVDDDYLAAIEYAPDKESKSLYAEQAARIAEIQKGILAVSAKEKPYDIFICYKENDEDGRRTRDSQWAQDIYYGLTDQGYKVFFSRITLEDKLGQEYEPYIFAALNSARVMLVIGSKPEYFNAVWVKNEWSRYLALMVKDRKRLLIPCYRDMDPYDLPEELSMLQSQDMGKIGFLQDLIRGIKKVLDNAGGLSTASSKVPSQAPEKVKKDPTEELRKQSEQHEIDLVNKSMQEELQQYEEEIKQIEEEIENRKTAFASAKKSIQKKTQADFDATITDLESRADALRSRSESAKMRYLLIRDNPVERKKWIEAFLRQERQYQEAQLLFEKKEYLRARDEFKKLDGLYDSAVKAEECEKAYMEECYQEALELQRQRRWADACDAFADLEGYLDSDSRKEQCRREYLNENYKQAVALQKKKQWADAYRIYDALGSYLDSAIRKAECQKRLTALEPEEPEDIEEIDDRDFDDRRRSVRTPKTKKKKGCLIMFLRFVLFAVAIGIVISIVSGQFDTKELFNDIVDDTRTEGDYLDGGSKGKITWEFQDNGLLIIRGNGSLDSNSEWSRHKSAIKYVQIEPGITSIGDSLFRYNDKLKEITIPNTVTQIGDYAFYNCESLEEINIPGSVKKIGQRAFSYSGVKTCVLENGIEEISSYAFYNAEELRSINIPGSVKKIGERAFSYSGIESCTLCEGITEISQYAFYNAANLKKLTLPNTITKIGDRAFGYCKLKEIVIPKSIKEIGSAAFRQSADIQKVYYTGSKSEWEAIKTDSTGLEKAAKVFDYR